MPDNLERINVIIAPTMGTDQFEIPLPIDVAVQALIEKLIESPELPFRAQEDSGRPIPWRMMWREGNRYLTESETLRRAGVEENNTLIMTQEARAGESGSSTTGTR